MSTVLQFARLVAILALLCVAAAIATPKGRLPLAFRGLAKMLGSGEVEKLRSCDSSKPLNLSTSQPPAGKRAFAFALVLLAILLALI